MSRKKFKAKLKEIFKAEHIIGFLVFAILFFITVALWYSANLLKYFGQAGVQRTFNIFKMALFMIKEAPWLFLLFTVISIGLGVLIAFLIGKYKLVPDKRGYYIVKESKRRPMTKEEMDQIFVLKDPKTESVDGLILGKDEDTGLTITLPPDPIDINRAPTNEMLIGLGPSGTRKTSGIIIPNLYQFIKMGRPICVSDPKGELYKHTAAAAVAYGYKIYILNTITNHGIHSDGVDILKPIREATDEEALALIDLMVDVILKNTSDGKTDVFWDKAAENCLRLILLIVTRTSKFTQTINVQNNRKYTFKTNSQGEHRTMMSIYSLMKMNTDDLIYICEKVLSPKDRELIDGPYHIWADNREHAQVKASLATQLNIFNNPTLVRILSEPDIDFDKIATEKAIVYLECPDQSTPYACVLSMFVTMLFYNIERYVDTYRGGKALEHPYSVIFEEMGNIGRIPNISQYLATCRSRGMPIHMYLQSISMLQDIYGRPDKPHEWESMLDNCSLKLLIGAANAPTAELFEKLCGKMKVRDFQQRRDRHIFTKLLLSTKETQTERTMEIPVYSASELLGDEFAVNKILIVPSQHNALLADKCFYEEHELFKYRFEGEDGQPAMVMPSIHLPSWQIKERSDDKKSTIGSSYTPANPELKVRYYENFRGYYEDLAEEDGPPKEKTLKERIEDFLFEPEQEEVEQRPRIISSRPFSDFKRPESYVLLDEQKRKTDEELRKKLSGILYGQKSKEYSVDIKDREGYTKEKDEKAFLVFGDNFDW